MLASSLSGANPRNWARRAALAALLSICGWLLLACSVPAAAREEESPAPPVKWLLVQARDLSGEGPPGLEAAVTRALQAELSAIEGWSVWVNDPQSPQVQKVLQAGLLTEAEAATAPDLASARRLGLAWGADTVLVSLIVRQEEAAVLLLNAIGVLGRETAGPGKPIDIPSMQAPVEPEATAETPASTLTEGAGEKLLAIVKASPALWRAEAEAAGQWEAEGDSLMAEGRFGEACAAFETALSIDAARTGARRKLAEALLALGQADEARRLLEEAYGPSPKEFDALLALGEVYLALGGPGRAAGHFRAAALLAPDDLRPLRGLARADLARGNITPALQQFDALVAALPEDAALHCEYAQALAQAGLPSRAREEFLACLELDPENPTARLDLAELYFSQRQLPEAVEQLRLLSDETEAVVGYPTGSYDRLLVLLAREFNAIFEQAGDDLDDYFNDVLTLGELQLLQEDLHLRSDNLARVFERISPPEDFDRSHRFWVLAANLLNHSDFELLRYANNEGGDFLRRYLLFRNAAREAAAEAASLAQEAALPAPAASR